MGSMFFSKTIPSVVSNSQCNAENALSCVKHAAVEVTSVKIVLAIQSLDVSYKNTNFV
jgi:hypothetical protein